MSAATAHAEYHANPALGGSTVAKIVNACIAEALAPVRVTPDMIIGSCVDAIWVEEMDPADVYSLAPDCDRRSAANKKRHADHAAECESAGLYPVTQKHLERINNGIDALALNNLAQKVRAACEPQKVAFWEQQTPHGPLACKGMFDLLGPWLADLKCYGSLLAQVLKDCRFKHVYQLAHYRNGARATGNDPQHCGIIATPTAASDSVIPASVIQIAPDLIDEAAAYLDYSVYPAMARMQAGEPVWTGHITRGDIIKNAADLIFIG